MPDPEGAASLIEIIGKITANEKLDLDAKQLRKEGAKLRKQMEEISDHYGTNNKCSKKEEA